MLHSSSLLRRRTEDFTRRTDSNKGAGGRGTLDHGLRMYANTITKGYPITSSWFEVHITYLLVTFVSTMISLLQKLRFAGPGHLNDGDVMCRWGSVWALELLGLQAQRGSFSDGGLNATPLTAQPGNASRHCGNA